ncbi:hypothetical protein [Haloprofundus halobius]|uniref:hypothetical protein n=1 Tax=Haloprofundus halobius TaxID=2876194 RepID=UPI001CCA678B|nr:hypothetical protein [Haloprofundus halobius]
MTDDPDTFETLSTLLADLSDSRRAAVDSAVDEATGVDDLRDRLTAIAAGETGPSADVSLDDDEVEAVPVTTEPADADGAVDRLQSRVGGLRDRVASGLDAVGSADAEADETTGAVDADVGTDERAVASESDADTTGDDLPVPASGPTTNPLARVRGRAASGVTDLKHTVRNADPKQAALWGLATGATLANPAIAASYSTAVLLSGAVLGGGAVGAYASSHEETVFDDLDPLEMIRQSRGMAAANAHRTNVNGRALGSLLGASTYLAESLTPEEYAHWLADVDADLVARGAELGAEYAVDREELGLGTPRSGAALGGGFGLVYGLATGAADGNGDSDDVLRELLDEDLYDEYSRSLDEKEERDDRDERDESER